MCLDCCADHKDNIHAALTYKGLAARCGAFLLGKYALMS